jgi:hypothetical protein
VDVGREQWNAFSTIPAIAWSASRGSEEVQEEALQGESQEVPEEDQDAPGLSEITRPK